MFESTINFLSEHSSIMIVNDSMIFFPLKSLKVFIIYNELPLIFVHITLFNNLTI